MTTVPRALSSRPNGPLMARTPSSMIGTGAFVLVEPRGFEPLTSCLQIMLIAADTGADLDGRVSASDRC
jgi:hypothetical protein